MARLLKICWHEEGLLLELVLVLASERMKAPQERWVLYCKANEEYYHNNLISML